MSQDQSILRRNKVDWLMAKDDRVLTTMRFIPQHKVVQKYGVILPDYLTNQAMKESEAYNTYYDLATRKVALKPKYVRQSTRKKTDQAPQDAPGKRLKATTKVAKSGKKKQPARGLETLSEIALSEAEQMKIAIERSKTQLHSSYASGSGADEGTISISKDDDDDADDQDDDDQEYDGQDDKGQDDVNEQTESNNDGDDFVHSKFSTHDQEERQDEEDKQEEGSDLRMDEEKTNKEEEVNELYRDVNVNLKGRDTEMTDAPQTNVQGTQVIEDTHAIITAATPEVQQQSSFVSSGFISNMLNPNPDTGTDFILNLNTESTTLVDVPVTSNAEMPPSSAITPPPPPIPPIQPLQQTPVPTPTIVPSTSLQDLPNFGSLFKFEDRVKALEDDFSEFKQTNQFAVVVSLIPGIVDTYLANKMNEAVKIAVQLQSDRLRDEAQVENEDFINKLDDNIKKIIKEQVKAQVKEQVTKILLQVEKTVNEQLKAEILTRSSNEAKTSHAVAANQSELEMKKILIDKMESNKSIHRSDQQKTLYKALVDAYESDKLILHTYGDTVTIKRRQDDQDEDEEPFAGSNWGSKRRRAGKEPESTTEEPIYTDEDLKEPAHQEFDIGFTKDQPKEDNRDSFNELMDTPLDFSAFMMNRLKVDTLTPKLLAGPTFELMKGLCKSLVELEYFLEEVCKATTDKLEWNNPEGQQYPHDMRNPLPLIPNSQGRRVIPFDHFINNDIAYLRGGSSSRTYATSVMKTKAADYGHIKWIKDLHLDWIAVHRNDDKLYTFKEGDYKRLHLQDIEDMLLLLVQGKLTNLTIEERLALNISLRMFTRSIVIQKRVEDL
ncbi:hypothetical protein Tco_0775204 [Tanacetum coccineum]